MNDARHTTYERAHAGYDVEFEQQLLAALAKTILETSQLGDCNAIAIRTAETVGALLTALASALMLSPAATRSPTQIRKTCDELSRRLIHMTREAEQDGAAEAFKRGCFHGDDTEGSA